MLFKNDRAVVRARYSTSFFRPIRQIPRRSNAKDAVENTVMADVGGGGGGGAESRARQIMSSSARAFFTIVTRPIIAHGGRVVSKRDYRFPF